MYRYGEVQTALAKLHGAYPDHIGAFKGRLQHLQKLGLVPSSPGRGKSIFYTYNDVARWAFALELLELGMDPARVASMVSWIWLLVGPYLCSDHEGEQLFVGRPTLLIREMAEKESGQRSDGGEMWNINGLEQPRYVYEVSELLNYKLSRLVLINLSDLRRRLVGILAEAEPAIDEASLMWSPTR